MSMKSFITMAAMAAVTGLGASIASAQITIPTVPIGNPGNEADVVDGDQNAPGVQRLGSVAYSYNIGTTEVTNAQYTAFLNAKAATDTFILYSFQMSGGITRSGSAGAYTYATVSGRANNPVNFVSFWDACRFANWLHNGQGSGDTETGAYTLTAGGISANAVTRNADWQWAVTSENEWYKAAYHQLASAGGDSDNYWLYPTQSDAVPTTTQVNYLGVIGNTRPVGSYAVNYYGTFDMGGNVSEWNESRTSNTRNYRGGSFSGNENFLQAISRTQSAPSTEASFVGFRVSQRPAPSPVCDSIDFNGDGLFPDDTDLVDFLSVLAGGPCTTGTCNDIDFNNDELFPDDSDLIAFLRVLAGGAC